MVNYPTLKPGRVNILSGRGLQDMGFYFVTGGGFISAMCKYDVYLQPGGWDIRLHTPIKKKKKS